LLLSDVHGMKESPASFPARCTYGSDYWLWGAYKTGQWQC
jgi:hypothetical protein